MFDQEGRLQAKTVSVRLTAGAPKTLQLCCPQLGIKHFRAEAEASLYDKQMVGRPACLPSSCSD